MIPPPPIATPTETRSYISDMLSQLADLAGCSGDRGLETSMRLLAVQAASTPSPGAASERRGGALD